MASVETPREISIDKLSPREIIDRNLRVEREEIISIDDVLTDVSIVDEYHAERLGESMSQDRGQLTPILVRARLEDNGGGIFYDVMDGFHRAEGRRMRGQKTVRATVVYACSDAEMVDLRILAASSVQSVQFPRLASWITQAWKQTEWAKKEITVVQAFAVAVNDSDSSRTKLLSREDIPQVRDWVREKCRLWQRGLAPTYEVLRIVADADPELVKRVRALRGGVRNRKGQVTPARLKPVVLAFPGEENFDAQNIVMDQIVERRLTASESEWFVNQIASKIYSGKKIEDVDFREIASKIPSSGTRRPPKNIDEPGTEDLSAIEEDDEFEGGDPEDKQKTKKPNSRLRTGADRNFEFAPLPNPEDIFGKDPPMPESSMFDEPSNDELRYAPDASISNSGFAGSGMTKGEKGFGVPTPTTSEESPDKLRAKIFSLREALRNAHEKLLAKNGDIDDDWFETAHFLTEEERKIMELFFRQFLDLDTVASIMHEPRLRVIQFVQSAFRKRYLEEESAKAELPADGKTTKSKKSASVA